MGEITDVEPCAAAYRETFRRTCVEEMPARGQVANPIELFGGCEAEKIEADECFGGEAG